MRYTPPRCVVVLTAIPDETRATLNHIGGVWKRQLYPGTVYRIGTFRGRTGRWKVAVAQIEAGNPRAAEEAVRAIENFHPHVLLFVGVAGGLKAELKLGDVVAGSKVYGYEFGKEEKTFRPRPEVANSDYNLVQMAKDLVVENRWQNRIDPAPPEVDAPAAFVKPITAGEKIIASTRSSIYRFLKKNYSDAFAVEMEGFGLLSAAHSYPNVRAIVIRGISDLIDDKVESDGKGWQDKASKHAAAFAFELLDGLESVRPDKGLPWFLPSEDYEIDDIASVEFVKLTDTISKVWDIVEYLVQTLKVRRDPFERYWTYVTLGKIGSIDHHVVAEALIKGLDDPEEFVRQGAQEGLELLRKGED